MVITVTAYDIAQGTPPAPVLDTTKDYTVAAWVTLDRLPGNYASVLSQDGRATENPFYLQYGQGAFAFSTDHTESYIWNSTG